MLFADRILDHASSELRLALGLLVTYSATAKPIFVSMALYVAAFKYGIARTKFAATETSTPTQVLLPMG